MQLLQPQLHREPTEHAASPSPAPAATKREGQHGIRARLRSAQKRELPQPVVISVGPQRNLPWRARKVPTLFVQRRRRRAQNPEPPSDLRRLPNSRRPAPAPQAGGVRRSSARASAPLLPGASRMAAVAMPRQFADCSNFPSLNQIKKGNHVARGHTDVPRATIRFHF